MAIKIKKSTQGSYRAQTGTPAGKKISAARIEKDTHSSNLKTKRKAVFAQNARKWNKG